MPPCRAGVSTLSCCNIPGFPNLRPGHEGFASWKMVPDLSWFTNTYFGINSEYVNSCKYTVQQSHIVTWYDRRLAALQQVQGDPSRKFWHQSFCVVESEAIFLLSSSHAYLQQCCNSPWKWYEMSLPRLPQVQLSLVPARHPVLACSGASSPAKVTGNQRNFMEVLRPRPCVWPNLSMQSYKSWAACLSIASVTLRPIPTCHFLAS